jgi:hypothetical protein
MAQVLKHLSSKYKALSSNPSTNKKKKKIHAYINHLHLHRRPIKQGCPNRNKSTQSLVSKYHFPINRTEMFREMAYSRADAGKVQDEPGVFSSARR